MITGGTYVRCSHCKRRRKIKNGGAKWFRRHRRHNAQCWDWKVVHDG